MDPESASPPVASIDGDAAPPPPPAGWAPPPGLDAWLVEQLLQATELEDFLDGLARRLVAAGLPLWRLNIARSALDPTFSDTGCTWRPGGDNEALAFAHEARASAPWQTSPLKAMIDGYIPRLRRRLTGPEARIDYPVLAEFRDGGATDWLAYLTRFLPDNNPTILVGTALTVAVDAPEGLTPAQVTLLDWLAPRVAGVVFRLTLMQSARTLIDAYIGSDAGRRIVSGQIRRGDVVSLPAVLMVADLRGFTAYSEAAPAEHVIAALNGYLGATADAIAAQGGAVLKFLGDGLLAVFSLEQRPDAEVCRAALAAAEETLSAIAALNAERAAAGEPVLEMDLVLHRGEVLYGNVGSARRLDFTVIGPAVNQACRIEALCEPLGQQLLLSESFAKTCGRHLRPLGEHRLRGVAAAQALYTLA